jgi:hypothetical protein
MTKKMASGGSTNVLGKGILARQAAIAKGPLPHPLKDYHLKRAALLKNKTALVRPPPVQRTVGIVPGSTFKVYDSKAALKMASGGSVGSASKRADGIATKGKTKGKMI